MGPGRDADAWIAEHVFGWTRTRVPVDVDGKNAGETLTKDGVLPRGYALPLRGRVHVGFFVPRYSTDPEEALALAEKAKMKAVRREDVRNAWAICVEAMRRLRVIPPGFENFKPK